MYIVTHNEIFNQHKHWDKGNITKGTMSWLNLILVNHNYNNQQLFFIAIFNILLLLPYISSIIFIYYKFYILKEYSRNDVIASGINKCSS